MTSLFRRDLTANEKIRTILKLTREHARNLAAFAALYKTILAILKGTRRYLQQSCCGEENGGDGDRGGLMRSLGRIIVMTLVGSSSPNTGTTMPQSSSNPGLPENPRHALIAGAIGGYAVWGRYSSVNYQIVLYLTSRIIVGGLALARERGMPPFSAKMLNFDRSYRLAAAVVWGVVMVLFEEYPHVLHPSLKRSMDEIYRFLPPWLSGGDGDGGGDNAASVEAPPGVSVQA
eukprot:CAMPEP_0181051696 /NCGR_PEP_ID=MMETSP1070-20121207/17192_1 /TAXON_ID=265543 /ORGANISM="Minutocellus polymorphus, Strain NH13" /LENGTH=231 /DNA_ID=CAMNT_0023130735 /DNA_START=253 /DNA_END=945 /DNA_ORIENTATION=+